MTMMMSTRLRSVLTGPLNLVVDGNSISSNVISSIGSFDNHLASVEPLRGATSLTHVSFAEPGHSWANMLSTHVTSVDAAWVAGATNVLVVNETLNSLYVGTEIDTVKLQITNYVEGRLSLHPWHIVYWLTLPYGGGPEYATINAKLLVVDAWVTTHAERLGIARVVNPRQLTVFNHDGSDPAQFEAFASSWHETSAPYTHPLDSPKLELAELIGNAIATLRP